MIARHLSWKVKGLPIVQRFQLIFNRFRLQNGGDYQSDCIFLCLLRHDFRLGVSILMILFLIESWSSSVSSTISISSNSWSLFYLLFITENQYCEYCSAYIVIIVLFCCVFRLNFEYITFICMFFSSYENNVNMG